MRKILLTTIISVSLMVCPVYASDIDIKSMETKELSALKDEITAELVSRIGDGWDKIGDGIFVVGEHIKPGMYEFMNTDDLWSIVRIYNSIDDYQSDEEGGAVEHALLNSNVFDNDTTNVNLSDGQVMVINGSGFFRENKPSWAP